MVMGITQFPRNKDEEEDKVKQKNIIELLKELDKFLNAKKTKSKKDLADFY